MAHILLLCAPPPFQRVATGLSTRIVWYNNMLISSGPSNCSDGDVQLMGGENKLEGRVEICCDGVWGTVCNNGWDERDATVVCNLLGFGQPGIILIISSCVHVHSDKESLEACCLPGVAGQDDTFSL